MAVKQTVLAVEDENAILHVLTTILETNDYSVITAKSGEECLLLAASHNPDIILLDLGLPKMDGVEVLTRLREWYNRPILIISARDTEKQKVEALDLGADDYITKPFSTGELLARIRSALRHKSRRLASEDTLQTGYKIGDFSIDFEKHTVCVGKKEVHLTQIEFKITELLARNAGRVLTYDYIMEYIWGPFAFEDNKILRVNMANIRRKIEKSPAEPEYILTETGIGYRMTESEED